MLLVCVGLAVGLREGVRVRPRSAQSSTLHMLCEVLELHLLSVDEYLNGYQDSLLYSGFL